jgi:hypothetical protein
MGYVWCNGEMNICSVRHVHVHVFFPTLHYIAAEIVWFRKSNSRCFVLLGMYYDDPRPRPHIVIIVSIAHTHTTQCIKFKTHSSIFLNRFEALNLSLMQKMQNWKPARLPPPTAVAARAHTPQLQVDETSRATSPAPGGVVPGAGGGPAGGGVKKKKGKKKK